MLEEAKKAIKASSKTSAVYVGCDSTRYKRNGKWYARYSTVIVIHLDGNHGCKLFHETKIVEDYGSLKQRLMAEVQYAIEAATEIIDVLDTRHLSVHLDLNADPKHKSNVAVKEAIGYVWGMLGIEAEIKPNAWAASYAADRAVRNIPLR